MENNSVHLSPIVNKAIIDYKSDNNLPISDNSTRNYDYIYTTKTLNKLALEYNDNYVNCSSLNFTEI